VAFIRTIPLNEATGDVRTMYERAQAAPGYVPNYTQVFSGRPDVYSAWSALLGAIRGHMDARRYELVTLAAARSLRSSYCALAHGQILSEHLLIPGQLDGILEGRDSCGLEPVELAVMQFAERVAADASSITLGDVQQLRDHGLTDDEIFDVAAAAAARCFFSKLLDALGAEPDAVYASSMAPELVQRLALGRSVSTSAVERLDD